MRRREFLFTTGGIAVTFPLNVRAQQSKMQIIGFLDSGSSTAFAERLAFFRRGLAEVGFVEGQNVSIEFRWAEGQYERLPAFAADLVRRNVDVIAATGSPNSARAAQSATSKIPIVFANGGDPVRDGLVSNLSRPTGNSTGFCYYNSALVNKRLGVLRELAPNVRNVGFLLNPNNPNAGPDSDSIKNSAQTAGIHVSLLNAGSLQELNQVFTESAQQKVDGIVVNNDVFFSTRASEIASLAANYAIPTVYFLRDFVAAGGLASYGTSIVDGYRRAAIYVGRILKGSKPSDLPVELASTFEMAVNLRAAKALGVVVPPTLLASADEVIE